MTMQRPNLLFIYTDQQRWDALGCAGNSDIHTPNLDKLAASGIRFSHAFANHPVCQPSRQSLLSGQYGEASGRLFNGIEMPEDVECLQHLLQRAGYETANIGKLHFKNHNHRNHRDPHPAYGFDTLLLSDEPGCYDDAFIKWVEQQSPDRVSDCRTDTHDFYAGDPKVLKGRGRDMWQPYTFEGPEHLTHSAFVGDQTSEFIGRRAQSPRPWFCIAGFYAPHPPLNPPRRLLDLYKDIDPRLPRLGSDDKLERPELTEEDYREIIRHYYALTTQVDEEVGRIIETLERTGQRDNTVVLFTSDHGECLGDLGIFQKIPPEDVSSRVPLIASWPGRIPAGQVSDSLIEAVDIAPSFLDWGVVQTPSYWQGRSFVPLAEGNLKRYQPRDSVYMSVRIPDVNGYKALRTADFLYVKPQPGVERFKNDFRLGREERLYDLRKDPYQLTNVLKQPAYEKTVHELRNRLLERIFDVDSKLPRRTGNF
jgi:arylsulfatase